MQKLEVLEKLEILPRITTALHPDCPRDLIRKTHRRAAISVHPGEKFIILLHLQARAPAPCAGGAGLVSIKYAYLGEISLKYTYFSEISIKYWCTSLLSARYFQALPYPYGRCSARSESAFSPARIPTCSRRPSTSARSERAGGAPVVFRVF